MNLQQARRSIKRQSYRKKYYEDEQQRPLGKYRQLIAEYHKGDPFLTLGPNYIMFGLSFVLINFFTVLLLNRLNQHEETQTFFLIITVTIIFLDTLWLASAFINPGIAVPNTDQTGEICQICQGNNKTDIVKKLDRYHCEECDVCIDEQEAHIQFIGGCVGKNNFIAFKIFLLGIFVWGMAMITIVPLTSNL